MNDELDPERAEGENENDTPEEEAQEGKKYDGGEIPRSGSTESKE